jgi:hypothetical protein
MASHGTTQKLPAQRTAHGRGVRTWGAAYRRSKSARAQGRRRQARIDELRAEEEFDLFDAEPRRPYEVRTQTRRRVEIQDADPITPNPQG